MLISELIEKLEIELERHGDVPTIVSVEGPSDNEEVVGLRYDRDEESLVLETAFI